MKIRTDFVSNSSSTSFCIRDRVSDAINMFATDFKGTDVSHIIEDDAEIIIECAVKDREFLSFFFDDHDYSHDTKSHVFGDKAFVTDIGYDSLIYKLNYCSDSDRNDVLSKIKCITFTSPDSIYTSAVFISLLYKYFIGRGFEIDIRSTDHEFLNNEDAMIRLISLIKE